MSETMGLPGESDRDILGYSRYRVAIAAFFAMLVISPYEYSWSSISGKVGAAYGWSDNQISTMFTLFVVFQSVGMLPGGMLRDRFGPRWTTRVAGVFSALGLFAVTLGPSYGPVLVLWCIGSFFTGFIYNNAVTTGNKWFRDRRGVMTGVIAGAFSWGSIPFIFWIQGISHSASKSSFFTVIYVMTGLVVGVTLVASMFMKDPPKDWAPQGWVPRKAAKRHCDHEYTLFQALADVGPDHLLHPDLRRGAGGDEPDRPVLRELRVRRDGRDRGCRRDLHRQRLREALARMGLGAPRR
jgi:OFA family oxalate/formate antiporter-like MFS transporter